MLSPPWLQPDAHRRRVANQQDGCNQADDVGRATADDQQADCEAKRKY